MGTMTLQKSRHVSCENTATATVGRTTEQRTVVVWRAVAATEWRMSQWRTVVVQRTAAYLCVLTNVNKTMPSHDAYLQC